MTAPERLIAAAGEQVGYLGKKSNAQLDSPQANPNGLWNKFARDLDALGDFYNGRKNGYDWCDVFVDWCFVHMFGWGGMGGGYPAESILQRSLDTQTIIGKLDGVTQGLCDGFYSMQNSINGLGMNVMQGFHGVDNAICNLGYQTQQGFNATQVAMMQGFNAAQAQTADCCCKTQTGLMQVGNQIERGFCQTNYNDQANTTAIIQNAHNDTDRVLARLDAMESSRKDEKIAEQAAEIQAYRQNAAFGAMISASEATILRRTGAECPTPAYVVQPPTPVNFPTNCCGQFNGWGNNGCGGCGSC